MLSSHLRIAPALSLPVKFSIFKKKEIGNNFEQRAEFFFPGMKAL
jgi:hypothetical protein